MLIRLEAARRILDRTRLRAPPVVNRPLGEAVGRLSARRVRAGHDLPGFDVSAMDGFAVRAGRAGPVPTFLLRGTGPKKGGGARALRTGEAVAIATGARLPRGADAVVRVEASRAQGELLHVQGPVHPGQDVIPRGESIRRGETILERGERVRPYHVGVLLAEGIGRLRVYDVRVSILPIGDDIRGPGRGPSGSTADLIGPVVARLFDFAAVRLLPPIPDDPARLRRAIASEVRRSDLLITIGGASVGARDVTKSTLSGMGEILFEGVRANVMKRGAVALVQRTPVLVLPGQIVSAVTNSHEHGLHLVGRMAGSELRRREFATLSEPVEVNHRMDSTYLFRVHDGQADPLPWGVARWSALLEANAFGVLPRGRRWAAGDRVELQWLESGGTAGPLGS